MCTLTTPQSPDKPAGLSCRPSFITGLVLLAILALLAGEARARVLYSPGGGLNYFFDSGQNIGFDPSWNVDLGDLDNDGDLDAAVSIGAGLVSDVPLGVWFNDGAGFFSSGGSYGVAFGMDVALGDLDGDEDLDVFVGTGGYDEGDLVWFNDGTGVFTDSGQRLGIGNTSGVVLGDLDGDHDLDAATACSWGGSNKIWINDGSGVFAENGQELDSDGSNDLALGDLDSDGDLDIFYANGTGYTIGRNRVWFNDGSAYFVKGVQILNTVESHGVALADLDGDTDLDAVVVNKQGSLGLPNQILFNNGTGIFTASLQELGNRRSEDVALADIDLDGDHDAVIVNEWDPNEVWLNDGLGNFSIGQEPGDFGGHGIDIGDLNGDNKPDIYFANHGGWGTVWMGFPDVVWFNGLHKLYIPYIHSPY